MKCGGCWAIPGALAQCQFYILLTPTVSQCQDPKQLQELVCCHTCGIMITGVFVKMGTAYYSPIRLHKCMSDVLLSTFSFSLKLSLVSNEIKLHCKSFSALFAVPLCSLVLFIQNDGTIWLKHGCHS